MPHGSSRTRLVRPVERQGMRDWLTEKLDNRVFHEMDWLDRSQGLFRIKWCHGSRHGWSKKETQVFEAWAQHTGRHSVRGIDPKRWKANFRCAINSLKDIEEQKKQSETKGQNAYRVFRMLGEVGVTNKKKGSRTGRRRKTTDEDEENMDEQEEADYAPDETNQAETVYKLYERSEPVETYSSYEVDVMDESGNEVENDNEADEEEEVKDPFQAINAYRLERAAIKGTTSGANIPLFEKINPALMEFGKIHHIPRHHSAFKVERIAPPTQPTPLFNIQHLFTSCTPQLPVFTPISSVAAFSQGNAQTIFATPTQTTVHALETTNSYEHVMFPETPEGSESSPDNTGFDTVELTILEATEVDPQTIALQQITPSSEMMSLMTSSSHMSTAQSDTLILMNNFSPLTPP